MKHVAAFCSYHFQINICTKRLETNTTFDWHTCGVFLILRLSINDFAVQTLFDNWSQNDRFGGCKRALKFAIIWQIAFGGATCVRIEMEWILVLLFFSFKNTKLCFSHLKHFSLQNYNRSHEMLFQLESRKEKHFLIKINCYCFSSATTL